ncbi:unnamed protein product, partial [Symbiodinium sp. KB8]
MLQYVWHDAPDTFEAARELFLAAAMASSSTEGVKLEPEKAEAIGKCKQGLMTVLDWNDILLLEMATDVLSEALATLAIAAHAPADAGSDASSSLLQSINRTLVCGRNSEELVWELKGEVPGKTSDSSVVAFAANRDMDESCNAMLQYLCAVIVSCCETLIVPIDQTRSGAEANAAPSMNMDDEASDRDDAFSRILISALGGVSQFLMLCLRPDTPIALNPDSLRSLAAAVVRNIETMKRPLLFEDDEVVMDAQ